jgi:high-affinity iron transporter
MRHASLALGVTAVVSVLIWQALVAAGTPDPLHPGATTAVATMNIGILVFREGLECILVLAAITASMTGDQRAQRRPVAAGATVGLLASLATWGLAAIAIDRLTQSIPALDIQAATGLLAIVVLLLVMNWFFHRLYWTGWIKAHNQRKRTLVERSAANASAQKKLLLGLALLGFTSLYREGFEVVLFLQSYRLDLGGSVVLGGVLFGLAGAVIIGVLTFVAQTKLPYRQMLVFTGILLGAVLLVMVGEQAQEMQLAHWIPTTPIPRLASVTPNWMGLWFSVFPTVETLFAQGAAAALVIGSYVAARARIR